jgi:hypothetical protein
VSHPHFAQDFARNAKWESERSLRSSAVQYSQAPVGALYEVQSVVLRQKIIKKPTVLPVGFFYTYIPPTFFGK